MFYDYRMSNLQFGKIETGSNKGKVFMTAVARNTRFRMDCTNITLLPSNGNDEIIEMCRSVFPRGEKYRGTADIPEDNFDRFKAEASLANLNGENWTLLQNGRIEDYKLPQPMVMQYNADIPGTNFKKGEWVKNKTTGKLRIFTTIKVFCLYMDDNQPVNGWDPETRARSRVSNMYPAMLTYSEHPELFDKFEMEHMTGFSLEEAMEAAKNADKAPVDAPAPNAPTNDEAPW